MIKIDAQVHAYERNHPGRPWAATLHGPSAVTGDDMVAAMDAVGVDAAILVSVFTMYQWSTPSTPGRPQRVPWPFGLC
jgi:predicted TIM-barrel fold metal-dependent hydrolase